MAYFKFVKWLYHRFDKLTTKITFGDVGVYNHFDESNPNSLQQLWRTIVVLIFIGLPEAAVLWGIGALPVSGNTKDLIVVSLSATGFVVVAIILLKKAKRG
jgi:hypothetical protein